MQQYCGARMVLCRRWMQHASSRERGRWMSSDRPWLYPPWWRIPRLTRVVDLRRKQPHLPVAPALGRWQKLRVPEAEEDSYHEPRCCSGASLGWSPIIADCAAFAPLILGHRPSGTRTSSSSGVLVHHAWRFQGLLCSSHARRSHANPRESVRLSAGKDFTSI